jgi:hypothetical protein
MSPNELIFEFICVSNNGLTVDFICVTKKHQLLAKKY